MQSGTWTAESNVEESKRLIAAAARLIQSEVKEKNYSKYCYPSNPTISESVTQKEWIPDLFNSLMATLIKDELKQAAICHSTVQAARPKSVISPLLFGLGVELDHLYRSKWLVTELARLGFSVSYDDVTRYNQ